MLQFNWKDSYENELEAYYTLITIYLILFLSIFPISQTLFKFRHRVSFCLYCCNYCQCISSCIDKHCSKNKKETFQQEQQQLELVLSQVPSGPPQLQRVASTQSNASTAGECAGAVTTQNVNFKHLRQSSADAGSGPDCSPVSKNVNNVHVTTGPTGPNAAAGVVVSSGSTGPNNANIANIANNGAISSMNRLNIFQKKERTRNSFSASASIGSFHQTSPSLDATNTNTNTTIGSNQISPAATATNSFHTVENVRFGRSQSKSLRRANSYGSTRSTRSSSFAAGLSPGQREIKKIDVAIVYRLFGALLSCIVYFVGQGVNNALIVFLGVEIGCFWRQWLVAPVALARLFIFLFYLERYYITFRDVPGQKVKVSKKCYHIYSLLISVSVCSAAIFYFVILATFQGGCQDDQNKVIGGSLMLLVDFFWSTYLAVLFHYKLAKVKRATEKDSVKYQQYRDKVKQMFSRSVSSNQIILTKASSLSSSSSDKFIVEKEKQKRVLKKDFKVYYTVSKLSWLISATVLTTLIAFYLAYVTGSTNAFATIELFFRLIYIILTFSFQDNLFQRLCCVCIRYQVRRLGGKTGWDFASMNKITFILRQFEKKRARASKSLQTRKHRKFATSSKSIADFSDKSDNKSNNQAKGSKNSTPCAEISDLTPTTPNNNHFKYNTNNIASKTTSNAAAAGASVSPKANSNQTSEPADSYKVARVRSLSPDMTRVHSVHAVPSVHASQPSESFVITVGTHLSTGSIGSLGSGGSGRSRVSLTGGAANCVEKVKYLDDMVGSSNLNKKEDTPEIRLRGSASVGLSEDESAETVETVENINLGIRGVPAVHGMHRMQTSDLSDDSDVGGSRLGANDEIMMHQVHKMVRKLDAKENKNDNKMNSAEGAVEIEIIDENQSGVGMNVDNSDLEDAFV